MEITLRYRTVDRYSETRKFKTLKGAMKYAHTKLGAHPDTSGTFGYAVSHYGDAKLSVEGVALSVLFPPPASPEPPSAEDEYRAGEP